MFEDCTEKVTHPIEMRVALHLDESIYDLMASCTKSASREEPRPEQCEYQKATCVFVNLTSGTNETRRCEARRKGNTSWREMWHKSSFKLKKFQTDSKRHDVHFGSFACGGEGELCPPGKMSNVWETNKVTLNNQVHGDGEIDAYAAFRRVAPAALAVQTHVLIFRGDVLQTSDTYVLLETIDDKLFTRKWFGEDTALYEEELLNGGTEFKRFDGKIMDPQDEDEDVVEAALKAPANLAKVKALTLSDYDMKSVASHFAGESFTNHRDGACNMNNHYVLYNSSTHYLISHGMDQTYLHQCVPRLFFPVQAKESSFETREKLGFKRDVDRVYHHKTCGVGYECVHSSATCRLLYETQLAKLKSTPGLRRVNCPDWVLYVVLSMVTGTLLPLLVLLALRR